MRTLKRKTHFFDLFFSSRRHCTICSSHRRKPGWIVFDQIDKNKQRSSAHNENKPNAFLLNLLCRKWLCRTDRLINADGLNPKPSFLKTTSTRPGLGSNLEASKITFQKELWRKQSTRCPSRSDLKL